MKFTNIEETIRLMEAADSYSELVSTLLAYVATNGHYRVAEAFQQCEFEMEKAQVGLWEY